MFKPHNTFPPRLKDVFYIVVYFNQLFYSEPSNYNSIFLKFYHLSDVFPKDRYKLLQSILYAYEFVLDNIMSFLCSWFFYNYFELYTQSFNKKKITVFIKCMHYNIYWVSYVFQPQNVNVFFPGRWIGPPNEPKEILYRQLITHFVKFSVTSCTLQIKLKIIDCKRVLRFVISAE